MSDFDKSINASDLIDWIMCAFPDWFVGDVRKIVDHVNEMSSAQPEVAKDTNVPCKDTISRQAAIDGKISIQRANGVEIYSDEAVPVEYLKALPSSQPEIIMCNDCEHHRQNYAGDSWCGHPKGLDGFELMPTDFCSAAKRRTNERKTE